MPHPASPATASPPAVAPWTATYPGTPAQLADVRADLRRLLDGCPLADDVTALVHELAANSVTHSRSRQPGGTFTVRLTHRPGHHIHAEVQDQGGSWDGDLPAAARRPHGLYLLLALATRCGTTLSQHSRITWFRIDYPPPAGPPPP